MVTDATLMVEGRSSEETSARVVSNFAACFCVGCHSRENIYWRNTIFVRVVLDLIFPEHREHLQAMRHESRHGTRNGLQRASSGTLFIGQVMNYGLNSMSGVYG